MTTEDHENGQRDEETGASPDPGIDQSGESESPAPNATPPEEMLPKEKGKDDDQNVPSTEDLVKEREKQKAPLTEDLIEQRTKEDELKKEEAPKEEETPKKEETPKEEETTPNASPNIRVLTVSVLVLALIVLLISLMNQSNDRSISLEQLQPTLEVMETRGSEQETQVAALETRMSASEATAEIAGATLNAVETEVRDIREQMPPTRPPATLPPPGDDECRATLNVSGQEVWESPRSFDDNPANPDYRLNLNTDENITTVNVVREIRSPEERLLYEIRYINPDIPSMISTGYIPKDASILDDENCRVRHGQHGGNNGQQDN